MHLACVCLCCISVPRFVSDLLDWRAYEHRIRCTRVCVCDARFNDRRHLCVPAIHSIVFWLCVWWSVVVSTISMGIWRVIHVRYIPLPPLHSDDLPRGVRVIV